MGNQEVEQASTNPEAQPDPIVDEAIERAKELDLWKIEES